MSLHEENQNDASGSSAEREGPRGNFDRSERHDSRSSREEAPVAFGSIHDVNRLLGGGMSRKTNGEQLLAAIDAFKHWFSPKVQVSSAGQVDLTKIQVIGLEASEHNMEASAVILAYPVESSGKVSVLHHFVVLDSTLQEENQVRTLTINHKDYPVPVVSSDYVTESYMSLVDELVTKHFEQTRRNVEIIRTGWRTVASKVNFSEPEVAEVRNVVFYVQAAIVAMYNDHFNADLYFNLNWLTKNTTLEIGVDMSGRDGSTADGLPRRRDIAVSVAGRAKVGDKVTSVPLSYLGADIRLFYTPPQEDDRWSRDRRQDQPYYSPVAVINSIDTGTNSITPEQLLLGLAGSSVISANQAWAQSKLPADVARGEVDYRNTGLLGLLGPDKAEVEFDARTNLDVNKWGQWFFSLVDTELSWAIELEEGGDNSWIMGLLSDAADDDEEGEAIARLYDYADRLTNGHFRTFAKKFNVTRPLELANARYLTGTWIDEHGTERDLREWDLLRWMALNPEDSEAHAALDYQDIIDRTDLDVDIRISDQYTLLTRALGASNVSFHRYVELAYINPDFIKALAAAVAECKINIDQRNAQYSFGSRRTRGNTAIRNFRGGDLTDGRLNSRRGGDDDRGGRSRGSRGNGFGRGNF